MTRQRPFRERSLPVILFFVFLVVAAFFFVRCVSRWVGKEMAVDLISCPWCYKPLEDAPSSLTYPMIMFFG